METVEKSANITLKILTAGQKRVKPMSGHEVEEIEKRFDFTLKCGFIVLIKCYNFNFAVFIESKSTITLISILDIFWALKFFGSKLYLTLCLFCSLQIKLQFL